MTETNGLSNTPLTRAVRANGRPTDARLWKAAQDFQEVFLGQFVQTMRATEQDNDLFEPSPGRETFDAMFSQAIGKEMARDNSFGLREVIYRQMGGKFLPAGARQAAEAYRSDWTAPVSHQTPSAR